MQKERRREEEVRQINGLLQNNVFRIDTANEAYVK